MYGGSPAVPSGSLHRPYEGSQPSTEQPVPDPPVVRSSSPLRGAATPAADGVGERRHVFIAPTRGRNNASVLTGRSGWPGLHRPYEGSQRQQGRLRRPLHVFIAPTRGRNLTAWAWWRTAVRVSSPPLRGVATDGRPWVSSWDGNPESSSPLRRVATRTATTYRSCRRPRSSSPLRGVATVLRRRLRRCGPRSSSPLPGVATRRRARRRAGTSGVFIAPTRGRNSSEAQAPQMRAEVFIAATRGRNHFGQVPVLT